MTYQKVRRASKYHHQQRRDVRREQPLESGERAPAAARQGPGPQDLAILFECLEQLLDRLPASYRDIAVLRLQGVATDQIAHRVKRSRRTVFRALSDLEKLAVSLME